MGKAFKIDVVSAILLAAINLNEQFKRDWHYRKWRQLLNSPKLSQAIMLRVQWAVFMCNSSGKIRRRNAFEPMRSARLRGDVRKGISIHSCPRSTSLRNRWISFVRIHRDQFKPTGVFVVCSEHFAQDCFERAMHIPGQRRFLKSGSVPSILDSLTSLPRARRFYWHRKDEKSNNPPEQTPDM